MAIAGALAKSANLAGIAVTSGVQSFSYEHAADPVTINADGNPYNDCDAMVNARSTLTVTLNADVASTIKPGVKGATEITPSVTGAGGGLSWQAGTAISLGTMQVVSKSDAFDQGGVRTVVVTLRSIGAPVFLS